MADFNGELVGLGSFPFAGGSVQPWVGQLYIPHVTSGPPFLVSSNPMNGQYGIAATAPLSFVIGNTGAMASSKLNVTVDTLAISSGLFQAGYAGTIVDNGNGTVTVSITTHPPWKTIHTTVNVSASSL